MVPINRSIRAAVCVLAVVIGGCRGRDQQQLFDSATAALWRGETASAADLATRGEKASEPESAWLWKFRLLRAEIHLVRWEPESVPALLTPEPPATAAFAWVRAKRAYLQGQHALLRRDIRNGFDTLQRARELASAAGASDLEMEVDALIGQSLARLGRFDEADATLARMVARARAAGDHYREAVGLVNLSQNHIVRNQYDEALSFLEPVVARTELAAQLVYARALINAGISYAQLGDFDRALEILRRSVAEQEKQREGVYLEPALGELGNTFLLRGRYNDAIPYLQRALDVARAASRPTEAARWATNLASAFLEQRRWDEAQRFNDEARRLGGDERSRPYRVLFDGRIQEGRGQLEEARRLYLEALTLAAADPIVQWRATWRLASMAYREGNRDEAFARFESALETVERTWSAIVTADHRVSIQERLIEVYHQYVDALAEDGQIERALAVADSGRARELAQRHGVAAPTSARPAAFRRLAKDLDASLLFYWLGRSRSYAWLVTSREIRMVKLDSTAEDIEKLGAEYQQMLVGSLGDPLRQRDSAGDRLYARLVAPVAGSIPNGSRVVVIPDAAFGTMNLESLPVPHGERRYWIEDVEIAVAPSLGTLLAGGPGLAGGPRRPTTPFVLLIGDALATDGYPALRYASAEIDGITRAFPGRTEVYRGAKASPATYRAAMPETFGIVHFTAHAAANPVEPLDSAVILSPADSGHKLYARDVAEQPLTADLVTISACRSAGERAYAGEGLVGFAWAFLRAGARRVIAGLWDVDDAATARLMEKLYAEIAGGRTPADALRRAKLAMIAEGRAAKPYYWAPFQVFIGSTDRP
jgi:CHAT domain-containing protein